MAVGTDIDVVVVGGDVVVVGTDVDVAVVGTDVMVVAKAPPSSQ